MSAIIIMFVGGAAAILAGSFFVGIWLGYKMAMLAENKVNPVPAVFKKKASGAKAYTETDGRSMDADDPNASDPYADKDWEPDELPVM